MSAHEPHASERAEVKRRGALYGFAPSAEQSPARAAAGRIFPRLADWWGVFERTGVTDENAVKIAAAAERNGTSFKAETLALGYVCEQDLAQAMADEFELVAQTDVDPASLVLTDRDAAMLLTTQKPTLLVRTSDGAEARVLIDTSKVDELARYLRVIPEVTTRLRIVAGGVLRAALIDRVSPLLAEIATFDLFTRYPAYSARMVVNAWQGCMLGALAIGLPVAMWTWPSVTFGALHIVFTFFFLSCVALRFAAVAASQQETPAPAERPCPADLPVYSVLVALYKEAEVVGELIAALRKIDWPASKLDIKLVCEADDLETIAAIKACRPPAFMQIVAVPDYGPRTKPKALNYALQTCRGDFVVLYDAEDRPHPGQLVEAWQRFQASQPAVACLQAPLEITNGKNSWIARSFAFEYAALFRGLLPWLSRRNLLLPLGGTSNHFRRAALEEVGKWDPFNVTEDADLGARLLRFGYRTETIFLPTLEEAPETLRVWIPQRTRWFKGWLQSWLVHMRNPFDLYRELGPKSFLIAQILFGGMVISAAVHPVFIGTMSWVGYNLAMGRSLSTFQSSLLVVDTVNIVAGYVSFWMLGRRSTPPERRAGTWKIVIATPIYWMMMSYASWRSLVHLYRVPHLWEKTPHGAAAGAAARADRSADGLLMPATG
jgi:cellulose synthase/poly-beta-1,6-N-acetylglucosamine synthase-like glycosyltransferase